MNDRLQQALGRWIASEKASDTDEADAAMAAVFGILPLASPAAGFAERVMAQAGLLAERRSVLAWPWRAALAASLVLAGLAASTLPSIALQLVGPLSGIRLLEWGAALFLGVIHRLSEGLSIWSGMVEVGYGMRLALSTMPMLLAVIAALLLSITAFGALYGLLTADRRRSEYVQ